MKLMYNTTSVASQDLSRAGDIDGPATNHAQSQSHRREKGAGAISAAAHSKQSAAVPSHKGSPHQPQGIKTMHNNQ